MLSCGIEKKASRQTSCEHQRPNGTANDFGITLGAQSPGPERVHDGQEAVHADAGEEEHAPVHVSVKKGDGDIAERIPKRPVAGNKVEDPERQREDKDQIGEYQVHHVSGGLVAQLQRAHKDVQGHHIGDQSQNKDHAVHTAV